MPRLSQSRRNFLALIGAACPALAAPPPPQKITAVDLFRVSGKRETIAGVDGQFQVQPLHVYDEFRPRPYKDSATPEKRTVPTSAIYLRLRAGSGLEGLYGPIDPEVALVINHQLGRFLIGKDALAIDTVWDLMYRSNRHARAGHLMMAISAIDNALWDLCGHFFNSPVYRLLGGPSRASVEAYGSCLGFSVVPEAAMKTAALLKQEGFTNQKWFFAYGPGDGTQGLQNNVELVRVLREAVGPGVNLMFDAFMGWQLDYAISWAKQAEQYRPRWIEEAFPPDKLEAFVALRKATSIPIATGEHFYGRWEANRYLESGAISVVQADPEWCGGVSELMKICTVSSLYDAQVFPHGHSLHAALHVVAAQPPALCPMVEYLITKLRSYYWFEKDPLRPVNGRIELRDKPGFGIELDPAKIESQEPFKAS